MTSAERASIRTSALPTGSVTQTAPPPTAIPRAAASTSIVFRTASGHGIDLRDATVVGVGDPDRAGAEGDPSRRVPDWNRAHDPPGRRVDARDGSIERVGHPHGSRADGDTDRPIADLDRVGDIVALGIEAHDAAAAARARHPDRALPGRHPLRRRDLGGLVDDRPRCGVDHSHGVVLDALERLPAPVRSSSQREDRNRHRRRQHTREGADDERSAVERPTGTSRGFDELFFLACVRSRRLAGPERRKGRWQPLHVELVEVFGTIDILELELAQLSLLDTGQLVVGKHGRRRL